MEKKDEKNVITFLVRTKCKKWKNTSITRRKMDRKAYLPYVGKYTF